MIPKHAIELINAIRQSNQKLSTWERKFLKSVENQAQYDKMLTKTQSLVLEKIYAKVTGGGVYQSREKI